MSHFTVGVICNSEDQLTDLLRPYQENNNGSCPEEFLKFNDVEDVVKKEWETESVKDWYADFKFRLTSICKPYKLTSVIRKIKEDGHFTFIYDDIFFTMNKIVVGSTFSLYGHTKDKDKVKDGETFTKYYREIFGKVTHVKTITWEEIVAKTPFSKLLSYRRKLNSEYEFRKNVKKWKELEVTIEVIDGPPEVPYKEKYPDFKYFIEEYNGYKFDEKMNKYGYWENPNAKWDWYQIGGRWLGSLLVEYSKFGITGQSGSFENKIPNTPEGYKWVDICKIKDICFDKMKEISTFEILKNETEDGDIWDILMNENHPERLNYTIYSAEYFIKKYGNKENYVDASSSFSTYAVITPDGEWHSPGEMGWFGCSSESIEEKNNFENNFMKNFIEPYKDKYLIIVDCHI